MPSFPIFWSNYPVLKVEPTILFLHQLNNCFWRWRGSLHWQFLCSKSMCLIIVFLLLTAVQLDHKTTYNLHSVWNQSFLSKRHRTFSRATWKFPTEAVLTLYAFSMKWEKFKSNRDIFLRSFVYENGLFLDKPWFFSHLGRKEFRRLRSSLAINTQSQNSEPLITQTCYEKNGRFNNSSLK